MKNSIKIQLALVLCCVLCTFSACDDEDVCIDYTGTYYHLLKAKENVFDVEEKNGEFHVNVPAQGGRYEFVFDPDAYYVVHDGKEKKVSIDNFNFIMWSCLDDAINSTDFWTPDNPNTEGNLQNFMTDNSQGAASLDCFFGRFEGMQNSCIVTVNPNDQNRDRTVRIVLSTLPLPEAQIVLHQSAL